MLLTLSYVFLAATLPSTLVSAYPSNSVVKRRNATNACGVIRSSVQEAFKANGAARPNVPAELGYECLQSVPLHKKEALDFVNSIIPYMEWQTTLADLKNPPADYPYPALDILKSLDQIRRDLVHDKYANEYSYQLDIYKLMLAAHDGHLSIKPDLMSNALSFTRSERIALVSYSQDGSALPKIYIYDEIKTNAKASAVKKINGVTAAKFINERVFASSEYRDLDAGYNSFFYSPGYGAAFSSLGDFQAFGRDSLLYAGPNTTLTFENGTTVTFDNYARIRDSFEGVTDGESFYQRFCTAKDLTPASSLPLTSPPRRQWYPKQVTSTSETSIVGYYLETPGFEDVAVLSVLDFWPKSNVEFQAIAQKFLAAAKADGKKKIIVDLSGNGGGKYFLAYDLFRQFFPPLAPLDYNRLRENEVFNIITKIASGPKFDNYNSKTATDDEVAQAESVFNYRFDVDINGKNFANYKSKFGPVKYNGDNYTDIVRFNTSNPRISDPSQGFGVQITGLGSRSNFTQPFAAEDIIMLHDGSCTSSCSIFATNMKLLGKVKSIVVGGQPTLNPMQAIGGTRGSENWEFGNPYSFASLFFDLATPQEQAVLNTLTTTVLDRTASTSFNLRDVILPSQLGTGAGKGISAQFIREDADCRLFFTREMILDVRESWKKAVGVMWGGQQCVSGALGKSTESANKTVMPASSTTSKKQKSKASGPACN